MRRSVIILLDIQKLNVIRFIYYVIKKIKKYKTKNILQKLCFKKNKDVFVVQ